MTKLSYEYGMLLGGEIVVFDAFFCGADERVGVPWVSFQIQAEIEVSTSP
jgi:hypothetical protein